MPHSSNFGINKLNYAKFVNWFKMLICESMYREKKNWPISSPSRNILHGNPFDLEMPATWTRKTEALKHGAQFQYITVEIKERIETQNPPVWPPTKPPTDRHSTNFTKEHKSLKVSHLWSYWFQVSLFNLDERNWSICLAQKRLSLF